MLAIRTGGSEFDPQPGHATDLRNDSAKLESDIDKTERWLSIGRMLCTRFPYPNGELNTLESPTQDHHILITEEAILDKN